MSWNTIGCSATGTSHTAYGKSCEDAVRYATLPHPDGSEVLLSFAADGAGSAHFAAFAAKHATDKAVDFFLNSIRTGEQITEAHVFALCEAIYNHFDTYAQNEPCELNEFSCTLLGTILGNGYSIFFQIGDGVIIRNDGSDFYTPVFWPSNGEYQNTTHFLVDDPAFANLRILITEELVDEVALITDGLQYLALNYETQSVHQPFFADLFKALRQADTKDKVAYLEKRLEAYLNSPAINSRTDDDKTLFLGSRIG